MPKYRVTKDIVIPAGTEVEIEQPHTREYPVTSAIIVVDVGLPSTSELILDFEDALTEGLIEVVE